ncbi:MAG TPA: hypothetical protein VD768_00340 [Sphingomicrobium sp.]|nr:hypothetical protein [Sphingomicrobium sp.]
MADQRISGGAVSRNEGKIGVGDEAAVDAAEILEQVELEIARLHRPEAVARYLSAGDGWEEALAQLRGAFAPPAAPSDG